MLLLLNAILASKNNWGSSVAPLYLLNFEKFVFKLLQILVHVFLLGGQRQLLLALRSDVLRLQLVPHKPLAFLLAKLLCKHSYIVGLEAPRTLSGTHVIDSVLNELKLKRWHRHRSLCCRGLPLNDLLLELTDSLLALLKPFLFLF